MAEPVEAVGQRLKADVGTLEAVGTRLYREPGNAEAQAFLVGRLESLGYRPVLDEFQCDAGVCANVLTRKPEHCAGWLLGAHFDSKAYSANGELVSPAPGADDNASGVAVVLEVARALASERRPDEVAFVFFNVEEVNQQGSAHLAPRSAKTVRLINLDTVGTWPTSLGESAPLDWVADERSLPLIDELASSFPFTMAKAETQWEDDQAQFWAAGRRAVELTEHGCSPRLHTPQDTSRHLHWQSLARLASALGEFLSR